MQDSQWEDAFNQVGRSAQEIAAGIQELAAIGGGPGGAVTRLGLTVEERRAHELIRKWLVENGLDVRSDGFGNMIGVLSGSSPQLSAIAVGSHADSVLHGGRFDGVAGVVAAVQLARTLKRSGLHLTRSLWVVVFSTEEGARFGEPCLGSKAAAGVLLNGDATRLKDSDGTSLGEAMLAIGLNPEHIEDARWDDGAVGAFLELHIEQGRVLESKHCPIGLVDLVAGSTRLRITVTGRPDHSGGTPMRMRRDALVGAAEMIQLIESIAKRHPAGSVGTVGRLEVFPNNVTTVPGRVVFSVDLRDSDPRRQTEAGDLAIAGMRDVGRRRSLETTIEVVARTPPTHLWVWLRELLREACIEAGLKWHVMRSGAGHDAQIIARRVPSAVVFVPSHDGASHVPDEWTEPEQISAGLQVLLHAVRRLDGVVQREPG